MHGAIIGNRRRTMGLDGYPEVSIAKARGKCRKKISESRIDGHICRRNPINKSDKSRYFFYLNK
jgi:hypothetical protein